MSTTRRFVVWGVLAAVIVIPLALAATSPLIQWREPIYIAAGFAGVVAMILLLLQPLLATAVLPGLSAMRGRRAHRIIGVALLITIMVHVAGLWITSPPDVIDALLFRSATPFSFWGVIAMWCVFATGTLAALRARFTLTPHIWRITHKTLAAIIVATSVAHAMLIDGTMETLSKLILCTVASAAAVIAVTGFKIKKIRSITTKITTNQ